MFGMGVKCPEFDVKNKCVKGLRRQLELLSYQCKNPVLKHVYDDVELELLNLNKLIRSNKYTDVKFSQSCESVEKGIRVLFRGTGSFE